jgi:hypothetical protein
MLRNGVGARAREQPGADRAQAAARERLRCVPEPVRNCSKLGMQA